MQVDGVFMVREQTIKQCRILKENLNRLYNIGNKFCRINLENTVIQQISRNKDVRKGKGKK